MIRLDEHDITAFLMDLERRVQTGNMEPPAGDLAKSWNNVIMGLARMVDMEYHSDTCCSFSGLAMIAPPTERMH